MSPLRSSAYIRGGVTLFAASLDVWVAIGQGSIDFELSIALLPKFYLNLGVHASIPMPVVNPSDPVGSINSLAQFDPTKASFSVSAGVDINGFIDILVTSLKGCGRLLDNALKAAQKAFDFAKKTSEKFVAAYEKATEAANKAVMAAKAAYDRVLGGVQKAIDAANKAVTLATDGIQIAGQQAEKMVTKATELGQKGVDQAKAALERIKKYWKEATKQAERAVTSAYNALRKLVPFEAKRPMRIQSHSSASHTPSRYPFHPTDRHLLWGFSSITNAVSSGVNAVSNAAQDLAKKSAELAAKALEQAKKAAEEAVRMQSEATHLTVCFVSYHIHTFSCCCFCCCCFCCCCCLCQWNSAVKALDRVKSSASSAISAAEDVVQLAEGAMREGIQAAHQAGDALKKQAQDRLRDAKNLAEDDAFSFAKNAALTAFNEASADANTVKDAAANAANEAGQALDTARNLLESATGDVLKWLTALAGDVKNIFWINEAHFHSDFAEMISTQKIGFTLRARALRFSLNFDIDVDLGEAIRKFQKQIDKVNQQSVAQGLRRTMD